MSQIPLGELVKGGAVRDAIHVAIAPIKAAKMLYPGQHVGKNGDETDPIGIVDPFLRHPVPPGETFYLCLYPNTVTGMTHHWEHPAFPDDNDLIAESKKWIEKFAQSFGETYDGLMSHAMCFAQTGERFHKGSDERYSYDTEGTWEEFWKHYAVVTGTIVPDDPWAPYSCAC